MAYPRAKEDRVQFWLNQIGFARQKVKPLFDACGTLIKLYYGEASSERESRAGEDLEEHIRRAKAGIIYGWIDQSLSNMLDRNPVFQCFPETREAALPIDPNNPSSISRAAGISKIANHRYRETNQLLVDERCALDAFLFPYGVAKIGFEVDFDQRFQEFLQPDAELEFEDPAEEHQFLAIGVPVRVSEHQDHRGHIDAHVGYLQSIDLVLSANADELASVIDDHINLHKRFMRRPQIDANQNVKREQPWAVRWRPDMFLTDSMCMEGLQDARWIAFGWELPLEEVEANTANSNIKDLQTLRANGAPSKPEGFGAEDTDGFDLVRGWEIWAKNFPVGPNRFEDILVTVTEGNTKSFLREENEWPYDRLDDYPAEVISFQTGTDRWFHKPPMLMGGGDTVQALMNEMLDSYLSIVRKQKNVWLVDTSLGLSKTTIQDILDAPDGSVIEVPGLSEKGGGNAIVPLPFHRVPEEKGGLMSVLQQIFDRSLGTPQPVQMPKTDTATEASIIEKRNTSRENRRSGLLSSFQVRKARKMHQLDAQFQPDRLFLIDRNAHTFISMTEEMAIGEYQFVMDVTSNSTAVTIERSQWMDLLNLFAGLTPVMIENFQLPPNLPELARRLLVRGFNEHVVEEILPMLDSAAAKLQNAQANPEANGQFNPEAAAEAVVEGREAGRGENALLPDSFNRDTPNPGRQEGEAARG